MPIVLLWLWSIQYDIHSHCDYKYCLPQENWEFIEYIINITENYLKRGIFNRFHPIQGIIAIKAEEVTGCGRKINFPNER